MRLVQGIANSLGDRHEQDGRDGVRDALLSDAANLGDRRKEDTQTHNVAMTSESAEKTAKIEYRPIPSTILSNKWSISSKSPDDNVAFPRAIPPMARKTILQWNEWKSSCLVSPVCNH